MAIDIPEQYQSLKTKLETIVKKVVSPQEIPLNADLNDYTTTGFYACNLPSTDLQTLQNCPVTEGFSLLVEENKTFNETGYKQTLTTWGRNGKPQVYIRTYVYDDI